MTIKQRLYLLGTITFVGIISLLLITQQFSQREQELAHVRQQITSMNVELLMLRRNEKDFLLRMNDKYLDSFSGNADDFRAIEQNVQHTLNTYGFNIGINLRDELDAYQQGFSNLVNGYTALGLDSESGLIGRFNQAVDTAFEGATATQVIALTDFAEAALKGTYDQSLASSIESSEVKTAANALVKQFQLVGLEYNEGLRGDVRGLSHSIEKQFSEYLSRVDVQAAEYHDKVILIQSTLTAAIIAIFAITFALTLKTINSNLKALMTTIREVTNTNNVSLRVDIQGKDELSRIGEDFNHLLDNLEGLVSGSQQKAYLLTDSTDSMHTQLNGVIEQFQTQSEHTSSMAASVHQMAATINEISESTAVAAEGVHTAASNARSGRVAVQSTLSQIEDLSSTLDLSQQSISELNSNVDQIGGAVVIIQEIAEQTNLLALNAAIEAARAGEQGRGFAVVADEVRALASRTHQSTEEITNVVSNIQKRMSEVITDIDKCNRQGARTKVSSQELDSSLSAIINDMDNIQANSESIASAIEEQGIAMSQVSESINQLTTITDGNMHIAGQCLIEVDSVSSQANEMRNTVSTFTTSQA